MIFKYLFNRLKCFLGFHEWKRCEVKLIFPEKSIILSCVHCKKWHPNVKLFFKYEYLPKQTLNLCPHGVPVKFNSCVHCYNEKDK